MVSASSIRIREARTTDVERIAEIWIRSWQLAYVGQLPDDVLNRQTERRAERIGQTERALAASSQRRRVLVAEHDGRVAGFASVGPGRDEPANVGELFAIYLDPEAWGKGVGRELFGAATAFLREAGFTEAMLWVLRSNDRARRFYEAADWRMDGGTKTEMMSGVTLEEVRYRRTLTR